MLEEMSASEFMDWMCLAELDEEAKTNPDLWKPQQSDEEIIAFLDGMK